MEKDENSKPILSELGRPRRYITDHSADGKSVFSNTLEEEIPSVAFHGTIIFDAFVSSQTPVEMNGGADLKAMQEMPQLEGHVRKDVTTVRVVDWLPGQVAIMHRSVSIDYGVLISGELELALDSGESRLLKPGDVVIQRGTNHAWRNPHPTKTARGLFVTAPCVPLVINGNQLDEHIEWPETPSV
ncbi:uncharacterized protein JN550_009338 [Neoarthrinium moseri]|uniref:uncharacterized protein n=1 Tax=Neoarthrinium moseri TaxID=1658444 RepID=UPI001FDC12A6|nr:uncharacterized protein JN550_009338 [Neoarthrinium moseri]KAI1863840.1 hypothetical protein JN550_009338 [Neoarthrinium moseri]